MESERKPETESEIETESEMESERESEMESERKPEKESEIETESEMESERKPEKESEIETESEMESERKPETESEIEMDPEMKFFDFSLWHHLIFVEELADDVSDKAICELCYRLALGPVYKCLECDFIQHKSCLKPTGIFCDEEEEIKYHHRMERHHLMLVEDVENNLEEEICYGCEEALCTTPAYKCSIPGCSFLFHHSCAQLPHVVQHAPQRQDYMLTLQSKEYYINFDHYLLRDDRILMERQGEKCNFCLKPSKYLFYICEPFDFHLHIKCLPLWQSSAYASHEHRVFPTLMADPFPCQACGEESRFFAYTCDICRLMMEKSCCDFSHSIQTRIHGHSLTFTPAVRQINKQDRIFCRACRKRVNTKYGGYYCVRCGYILHLKCARWYEDRDATIDESVPGDCDEHTKYLVEGLEAIEGERFDGPEKIKHIRHPEHELLLEQHEEPGYDKRCEACMRFIFFVPYYGCVECNFFLHSRCGELPMTIKRGLFHEHPLTLHTQTPSREEIFKCHRCDVARDGYLYICEKCNGFHLDVQCGLIPEAVPHILHEHTLFLVDETNRRGSCNNCKTSYVSYICNYDCEFSLCLKCITIPQYVRYRYHSHPLTITNTCDNSEEYYCLICEEKREPKEWFYWCKECDFTVHHKCILKGNFKDYGHYVSEYHEHPLFFVQKTEDFAPDFPPCAACGQPFVGWRYSPGNQAVECRECEFVIHRSCQTEMFSKQS